MTLAVDVNPLVYASHSRSPFHIAAANALDAIRRRREMLYVFWPVAVGYIRVATSPRLHKEPLSTQEALDNVSSLVRLPYVHTGIESEEFLGLLSDACLEVQAVGNVVSDAYVVALMRQHGIHRILTHDRDFRKFDGIEVVDPFEG